MAATDMRMIGKRIRDSRRILDLTQREVAAALEVSQLFVSRLEQGRLQRIPMTLIAPLAHLLQTSADFLFGLTDVDPRQAEALKREEERQRAASLLPFPSGG